MTTKLSIVIITKDEENNIERCLRSVRWADEIVVVDSGSSDRTLEICRSFNCTIIQTPWLGFGPTKKMAVASASNDWILSIDADEEVTDALRQKIISILLKPVCQGYRIKRTSFYLGRQIRYSGWNTDAPIRFFNRKAGNFNDRLIHESVSITGETGIITEPLRHYPYQNLSTYIHKMNLYTELGADELKRKGRQSSPCFAVIRGILTFINMFLLKRGFLDGPVGLHLALNSAFGVYLKYLKLWEKSR